MPGGTGPQILNSAIPLCQIEYSFRVYIVQLTNVSDQASEYMYRNKSKYGTSYQMLRQNKSKKSETTH